MKYLSSSLRRRANDTAMLLRMTYQIVEETITNTVTALGGLVRTSLPACLKGTARPPIYATAGRDLDFEADPVYGIRVADGEIFLLTGTSLDNYGSETGHYFGANEKDDAAHLEKALGDLSWFIPLSTYERRPTLSSIISGLAAFIPNGKKQAMARADVSRPSGIH